MHGNQMATNAVPVLSASDKVFSEMEILYETLDRLEEKLISKFDNLYVKPINTPEESKSADVAMPHSQTFNSIFCKTQTCVSRVEHMIDYVNNCES